jgi:hypothetical protein
MPAAGLPAVAALALRLRGGRYIHPAAAGDVRQPVTDPPLPS